MPLITKGIVKFKRKEIDDDVLTRLYFNNTPYKELAAKMQAIELASDYMKYDVLFLDGVLESILDSFNVPYVYVGVDSIRGINNVQSVKDPNNKMSLVSLDLRRDEKSESRGGHYTAGFVQGNTVYLYDSMCSPCGNHIDFEHFYKIFKKLYPGKEIKQMNTDAFYQPSGGFCLETHNEIFKILKENRNLKRHIDNLDNIFIAHQFDAMSQHHFCYIEALVFLSHMMYGTPMGPKNDLEKRLVFIKKVAYGFGKIFSDVSGLHNNYTYIMSVQNADFEKIFTIPRGELHITEKHFELPRIIQGMRVPDIIRASL